MEDGQDVGIWVVIVRGRTGTHAELGRGWFGGSSAGRRRGDGRSTASQTDNELGCVRVRNSSSAYPIDLNCN